MIQVEVVTSDESLSDFVILIFLLSPSEFDLSGSDIEVTDEELSDSVFSSIGGSISKILDFEKSLQSETKTYPTNLFY